MAKVYVVTKANYLEPEVYVTVKASKKEAEKVIRNQFPNAREDNFNPSKLAYDCRNKDARCLMFINIEEI